MSVHVTSTAPLQDMGTESCENVGVCVCVLVRVRVCVSACVHARACAIARAHVPANQKSQRNSNARLRRRQPEAAVRNIRSSKERRDLHTRAR